MIALTLAAALALNTDVTQATLSQTVCHPGYSASYRRSHPVHLKPRKGYVRDHIVPIVLGGASVPANLQYQTKAEAKRKDRLERRLARAVCSGRMTLEEAQERVGR